MKFLVIGESCLDVFVYGQVERLAPEAPVPVFNKERIATNPGMASNVFENLKSMGCDAELYTNEAWYVIKKTRYVETKSNHMLLRVDEADDTYGNCDVKNIDFLAYDCVVISDYNKGFLTPEQIRYIGDRARVSILDTKKILGPWAASMTFIKINESEYERTKSVLSEKIIKKLIVTLGPDGAMFQGREYPCPKVDRVDSCGAGDTFVAAFANAYTQHPDVHHAIDTGNRVASDVVQKRGVSTP
jgi:D-glycero-beta-D-manno-heptose-7-phosphate kinase